MIDHASTMKNIKASLLSLYIQSTNQQLAFVDYFDIFLKTLFNHFQISQISFWVHRDGKFSPISKKLTASVSREDIKWAAIQNCFKDKKICRIENCIQNEQITSKYDEMILLKKGDLPFGLMLYKSTDEWKDFENSSYLNQFLDEIEKLFINIYETIVMRSNEIHYRKLYQLTDLLHSTMDIDVILENVVNAIEENFPDFRVELILSNDQDRQTKFQIKQFDYLSERPSTIEAFVSGEMTIEFAEDLNIKLLNAPIKGRQAIYGVLQVQSPITTVYTEVERDFIRMLAQASGNALENAKLYHQSHRLISDLQLINETSHHLNLIKDINEMLSYLYKQLNKAFRPKEGCFILREKHARHLSASTPFFETEEGKKYINYVENHFSQSTEALFIADFSRIIDDSVSHRSIMAIPMLVENQINGYCIVVHPDSYYFSFDSFKLMQSFIQHSSLAISNLNLRNRLQEMVDRDHLTNLYARGFLDRYVENSLEQDESGMFLLLDIDNFKKINDTHGHQIGDEVLKQIANQLKKLIGTRGICARWGGEELAVYIPNLIEQEIHKIAGEIVCSIPFVTNPSVTISAGLVSWTNKKKPKFKEIFLQADTALYAAKNNGKNQYLIYDKAMPIKA